MKTKQTSKEWKKANVCALLKLEKQPDDTRNFRPILLLCHTFKLFERITLKRVLSMIEAKLIKEQVGYRGGKSCAG